MSSSKNYKILVAIPLDYHTDQKIKLSVFLTWFHLLKWKILFFLALLQPWTLKDNSAVHALNSCPLSLLPRELLRVSTGRQDDLERTQHQVERTLMQLFHLLSVCVVSLYLCCWGIQTQGVRGSLVFKCLYPNSLWCQGPSSSSSHIFNGHIWVFYNEGIDMQGTPCSWVNLQLCCRGLKQITSSRIFDLSVTHVIAQMHSADLHHRGWLCRKRLC